MSGFDPSPYADSTAPVKYEETSQYALGGPHMWPGVHSNLPFHETDSSSSSTPSYPSDFDAPTLVTPSVALDSIAHPPSFQPQSTSLLQTGPQIKNTPVSRQTPAANFTALFPPPHPVSVTTYSGDHHLQAPQKIPTPVSSSRSSSVASFNFSPFSPASNFSSAGDAPNFDSFPSTSSKFDNSPSYPCAPTNPYHIYPGGLRSISATDLTGAHSHSHSTFVASSGTTTTTDTRRHSAEVFPPLSSPLALGAAHHQHHQHRHHQFNPALTAVPEPGLPPWPGASAHNTSSSRAKPKPPKLPRTRPPPDYKHGHDRDHNAGPRASAPPPPPSSLTAAAHFSAPPVPAKLLAHAGSTLRHDQYYHASPSVAGVPHPHRLGQQQAPNGSHYPGNHPADDDSNHSILQDPLGLAAAAAVGSRPGNNTGTIQAVSAGIAHDGLFTMNDNDVFDASGTADLEPMMDEYEDEDVLLNLPPDGSPTSYMQPGDFPVSTPGSTESSEKKNEKQVKRRSSKACDQCRKSKCKCERRREGEPCQSCILLGTPCTFLGPSRKRGPPKGYIDAIESRLHQTEALVGIMLALANPERKVTDGEDPKPDERARSLLEDLRSFDPLAREIIERVDRGAYGTQGRRAAAAAGAGAGGSGSTPFVSTTTTGSMTKGSARAPSGSGDEKSLSSAETARGEGGGKLLHHPAPGHGGPLPPPSVHGRGRMVGLGQEIEMGGLASAHPSNEWQDTVTERLKAATRAREAGNAYGAKMPNGRIQQQQQQDPSADEGRERQRRRVDSVTGANANASAASEMNAAPSRSPKRGVVVVQPRPAPQAASAAAQLRTLPALLIPGPGNAAPAPAAAPPSYAIQANHIANAKSSACGGEAEDVEDVEEGITDGVGQLSINEESQVRFHGKTSGLHLLGQKPRMDGRNRGGVWHFPKARVWPPVARMSAADIARQEEVEALERAALARLPSRQEQEQLLDLYFAHVHIFLPIVHKETFMADFHAMMDEQERARGSPDNRDRTSVPRGRSGSALPSAVPMDRASSKARSMTAETDNSSSDRSTAPPSPLRIPTLLLLAMYAIAARFSPVAEGTAIGNSSSPYQVAKEALFSSPGSAPSTIHELVATVNEEQAAVAAGVAGASGASEGSVVGGGKAGSTVSESEGGLPTAAGSDIDSDVALPMPRSGHMWAAGDGYLERAKELLDKVYASSRPSTVQALLLMGYREIGIGAMASSWLYIGMAVRMAQDLGMHRNSDHWSYGKELLFSPVDQQIRKRVWYACVTMDKYVSTYIGRPLSIFEGDYDTPLPGTDESEETDLWELNASMPHSLLTDPIEIALAPNAPIKPVQSRVLSCFNESARLSSIVSVILHTLYAVKPVGSRHLEALQIERRLDKWYMDLPEPLRYDTNVKKGSIPSPNVLTLHMQYWCAVLLLHRPFIRHYIALRQKRAADVGSPVDPGVFSATQKNFDLCVAAANHIASLVSVYQDYFCLKRCAVFLSYYIFTAGIMHITILATNHNDPQASLGLSKCMDVLRRIEIVWPSAGRAWELLNGAKEDLPNHEVPFPSTERSRKRSADDPLALDDTSFLPIPRSPTQSYHGTSHHHRYGAASLLNIGDDDNGDGGSANEPPLALFGAYHRWTPENAVGFPAAGLSTSVLPQQYSTGFVEDRSGSAAGGSRRSPAAHVLDHPHHPSTAHSHHQNGHHNHNHHQHHQHQHQHHQQNGHSHAHGPASGAHAAGPHDGHGGHGGGAGGGVGPRGHLQYWSDFSMGPPSSMLGSMYGMSVLSPQGGPGVHHPPATPIAASPHSPHEYNGHTPFIGGEHYGVYGH